MPSRIDDGFQELYRSEYRQVFGSVFLLCGDRDLAEEAAQEAFARALARWRRLRHQPWAAGWITTTALNVARRRLRKRPEPPVHQRLEFDVDSRLDLWAAVRGLPTRQQQAVILFYAEDLPVRDVAASMGVSEGAIRAHLAKGRAHLRRSLGGEMDDR